MIIKSIKILFFIYCGIFSILFWWIIFPIGLLSFYISGQKVDIKYEWKSMWKAFFELLRGK